MRCKLARAAIGTAVETATADRKPGAGTGLRMLDDAIEPSEAQEGVFLVRLMSWGRDTANSCDAFWVVYQLVRYYAPSPNVDDRIADDSERIHDPLWRLADLQADIIESQPGDVFIEESPGRFAARQDVRIIYRRSFE